jgi:hypothetical protein
MKNTPVVTSRLAVEYHTNTFSAAASKLGLAPGQVPEFLETELGNGKPFRLVNLNEQAFYYRQMAGNISLCVVND